MAGCLVIAKVGGSLYDLPDLRGRLQAWATDAAATVVLVPGGGPTADVVRRLDCTHKVGEELAHWLALRALTVNAHFLSNLLGAPVRTWPLGARDPLAVLDPHAFALADEGLPGSLPHTWAATSDAIAARVAEVAGGGLVLLKSRDLPTEMSWPAAAAAGLVDEVFAAVVARARLVPEWVNLRSPDGLRQ